VQKAIDDLPEGSRVGSGIELVERLVREIASTRLDLLSEVPSGDMLAAIASRLPDGTAGVIPHPLIPLLDTALLTNAPGSLASGARFWQRLHRLTGSTSSWRR
jgi:hypothetical protein